MANSTVRISAAARAVLDQLAQHSGQTKTDVVATALEIYRRKVFFEKLNAGYAQLRDNASPWSEELAERRELEATLSDGLDPHEVWSEEQRRPLRKKKRR